MDTFPWWGGCSDRQRKKGKKKKKKEKKKSFEEKGELIDIVKFQLLLLLRVQCGMSRTGC